MKSGVVSLLFPPKCASCGSLLEFRGLGMEIPGLCEDCQKRWDSELLDTCGVCGQAVKNCNCMTEELQRARCNGFRKRVYYLHGSGSAVQNRILFKIKNGPSMGAIDFLADELEKTARTLLTEGSVDLSNTVLSYLPRSRKTLAASGTDQGKRLAYALADRMGIAVANVICRRRGKERQQKHLNMTQRRKNAKTTYSVRKNSSLEGKTVILIDDIVTTGSTMAAGVRLLRGIGAERVYALAVAVDDQQKNGKTRPVVFSI